MKNLRLPLCFSLAALMVAPAMASASDIQPSGSGRQILTEAFAEPVAMLPIVAQPSGYGASDRREPTTGGASIQDWNRRMVRECVRSGGRMVC